MNNYNEDVNKKYAAEIAEVCNQENGMSLTAEQVEGWAVYLSALLECTDCKQTVDQVLCSCMSDWGVWNSMIDYFKRNRNRQPRKTFH